VPHTITINDNQTNDSLSAEPGTTYDPSNNNLIDRLDATEAWGSNPFSSPSDAWGSSEASSSNSSSINRPSSPAGSDDSTVTVKPESLKAEFDHYFPPQD